MSFLIVSIFSYLLGSIPFGLLFSKIFGLGDIRNVGSGNIGATNVLRTGNKVAAVLTLFFDIFKGALALMITKNFYIDLIFLSFIAVYLGHIFPIWLKFKGGKGVATFIGGLIVINYKICIIFLISWALITKIFKISSLSALIAFFIIFIYSVIFEQKDFMILISFFLVINFFTHRQNIIRLIKGEETKIKS
ncbi:MAG: acyl-phosphate glycerol 3-phosphate acyltransferase [Candidatus Pelagibacter sp.]|nr:acyl-phosphate glycerol 3-phosphate acyltransferase [Candidatus Pelagibacter sp.]OUV97342.1 MAG: acyl-phosphate glycerol 3-phosphate acyltransferase [Candidatus Pelagibacter sp. TMED142]